MTEEIIGRIKNVVLPSPNKVYNLYFTPSRMIGKMIGGLNLSFALGGVIGQSITKRHLRKKAEEMMEKEETPEQILASHKKNFSVDYGDIASAIVKKKKCIMRFTRRGLIPRTGIRKKVIFVFDKKDKDNVASILTKVLPDKVVVK